MNEWVCEQNAGLELILAKGFSIVMKVFLTSLKATCSEIHKKEIHLDAVTIEICLQAGWNNLFGRNVSSLQRWPSLSMWVTAIFFFKKTNSVCSWGSQFWRCILVLQPVYVSRGWSNSNKHHSNVNLQAARFGRDCIHCIVPYSPKLYGTIWFLIILYCTLVFTISSYKITLVVTDNSNQLPCFRGCWYFLVFVLPAICICICLWVSSWYTLWRWCGQLTCQYRFLRHSPQNQGQGTFLFSSRARRSYVQNILTSETENVITKFDFTTLGIGVNKVGWCNFPVSLHLLWDSASSEETKQALSGWSSSVSPGVLLNQAVPCTILHHIHHLTTSANASRVVISLWKIEAVSECWRCGNWNSRYFRGHGREMTFDRWAVPTPFSLSNTLDSTAVFGWSI